MFIYYAFQDSFLGEVKSNYISKYIFEKETGEYVLTNCYKGEKECKSFNEVKSGYLWTGDTELFFCECDDEADSLSLEQSTMMNQQY